jgi:hypothetical protein
MVREVSRKMPTLKRIKTTTEGFHLHPKVGPIQKWLLLQVLCREHQLNSLTRRTPMQPTHSYRLFHLHQLLIRLLLYSLHTNHLLMNRVLR